MAFVGCLFGEYMSKRTIAIYYKVKTHGFVHASTKYVSRLSVAEIDRLTYGEMLSLRESFPASFASKASVDRDSRRLIACRR
jgi:hypothetical protein